MHRRRHPPADHTPISIYTHYKSRISCTTHSLLDVSIQSPTPVQGNLIPHNAFVFVVGPVCVRNVGERSVLDADHMEIIPADAGPPLATDESLFAQFPASNIDAVGIIADGCYRMLDQTYILPITITQFVRSGVHSFCIAFVILTNCIAVNVHSLMCKVACCRPPNTTRETVRFRGSANGFGFVVCAALFCPLVC